MKRPPLHFDVRCSMFNVRCVPPSQPQLVAQALQLRLVPALVPAGDDELPVVRSWIVDRGSLMGVPRTQRIHQALLRMNPSEKQQSLSLSFQLSAFQHLPTQLHSESHPPGSSGRRRGCHQLHTPCISKLCTAASRSRRSAWRSHLPGGSGLGGNETTKSRSGWYLRKIASDLGA